MAEQVYYIERHRNKRLFWGVLLIAIGALGVMDYLGMLPWPGGSHSWPLIVIVFGLAQAATAWSARKLGSGITLALMGGWCWIAVNHWHNFTWWNSWPMAFVASGAGMIVHSIAAPFYRSRRDREIKGVVNVDDL